jgi:hypothetical protein
MNYGIGNNIIPPELQYAFDLQEELRWKPLWPVKRL